VLLVKSISSNGDSPEVVALHETLWRGLYGMGTLRKAVSGTVLFREGDSVRGIFLLACGTVRLSLGKSQKSITYRVVRPQYILGLPATLLHRPYSLTAEVMEDAEFYFVESSVAMEYLREHAEMCMHVLEFLSHEMVWIRHVHAAQLENARSPLV
jgi:CRP-like cAMP-binding protein